ncbi:MAG: potassium channel family protein [Halobacteriales archaeon]
MKLWKRRAVTTVVAIVVLIFISSFVYHYTMLVFEGRSPTYFNSLRTVVETYTGTGYGADAPWETSVANLLIVAMDLSTFLLVFIVLPYVLSPVLEEVLSATVPRSVDMTDHVVVCDYTPRTEQLVDEFKHRDVDYVVLLDDEERAVELREEGIEVAHGDPSSSDDLRRVGVDRASSVVVDTDDSESASVVLSVSEIDSDVRVIVLVRDLSLEKYLRYAGADAVLTPRHLVGRRIAERIRNEVSLAYSDVTGLGDGFAIVELTVFPGSPLYGRRLGDCEEFDSTNLAVAGVWDQGVFVPSPLPETRIDNNTVLLVAGPEDELAEFERRMQTGNGTETHVVIAGYGEVGSTVKERLESTDARCTVIDIDDLKGVDVVGDATEEDALREAGIEDATAFVVTVQDDDEAILTVLVAREIVSDTDIVARVNDSENESKIRQAGADYVLSLPEISGRILAAEVLREEILSYDRQLKVVRIDGSVFAGSRADKPPVSDADFAVVAVERDGNVITDLPSDFVFREDDSVLVAGNDDAIDAVVYD